MIAEAHFEKAEWYMRRVRQLFDDIRLNSAMAPGPKELKLSEIEQLRRAAEVELALAEHLEGK